MISNTFAANTIRLAKVTYVHPEGQKLEVMFLDTGDYGRDVQVMSPYAGTDFGFTSGIPSPEQEGHEPNKKTDPNERHIIAVVATLQGRHICLGFLFPQVTHMAFTKDQDKNRMIQRHTSDWYQTVDDDGNMEMVHPSNAFILMGEIAEPTDLSGRDYDQRWDITRNTDKDVGIRLQVGDSFISIKDGVIDIVAPTINIVGDIVHTGNNNQAGVHTDSNGPHTA